MRNLARIVRSAVTAAAVLALAADVAAQQAAVETTLYERLGGLDGIAALVDRLVDRMAADETLQANPYVHEAMTRIGKPGLKYRLTTMLCASAGGPQRYSGRSVRDAHAHLRISGHEWRAFSADLQSTLEALSVAEADRAALLALVEPAANDIVIAGELDGRSFAGQRSRRSEGAAWPDEISFVNGRLVSKDDAEHGLAAGIYAASVGEQAISFEAESVGANGEKAVWKGIVKGDAISATILTGKTGEPARKASFTGRAKP